MKSILDKNFIYTPSVSTDVRKRFEEEKARLRIQIDRAEKIAQEAERVVAKTKIRGRSA